MSRTCRHRPRWLKHLSLEQLESRVVPSLFGQQIFPADNAWNQNIAAAPVAGNSDAIIAAIGTTRTIHADWGEDDPNNGAAPLYGIPVNIVRANGMSKTSVQIDNYPDQSDIVPVPIPQNAVVEGDYQNGPNMNGGGYGVNQRGDSHLIIWDEDNNVAYELYGVSRPNDPTLFPNNQDQELPKTDLLWHAAQETVWDMKTNEFRTLGATSADAAGLSILAGLARPDEGLPTVAGGQGVITHALRMTLPNINPKYIYPASHVINIDSQSSAQAMLGTRFRLKSTPQINAQIASMPAESQIIARAMQQYGMIVADAGSAMYVTGSSATIDTVDSPNTRLVWDMNDILSGLQSLTAGEFEVVDLTPRVTGLSVPSARPGTTITITGQNFSGAAGRLSVLFGSTPSPAVTILDDAHVTAVVPSMGSTGTVDVRVQSGIVETDTISGDPTANATAPIYGYGISAITPADHFTPSQSTWTAVDVTVASDGNARVLWSQPGGNADLWSVNGTTFAGSSPVYAVPGWTAKATAAGADGLTRVLWTKPDGRAALWLVNGAGAVQGAQVFGPFGGWTATALAVGSDGNTRLLWDNTSGQTVVWSVTNAFAVTTSPVFGPFSGWTAQSLASGGDGKIRLLWTNTSGATALWVLNADGSFNASTAYAAIAGWTAQEIAVGADGNTRILWTNTAGQMVVWSVDAAFHVAAGPVYGPFAGWSATRLAAGADGKIRVLWFRVDGSAALWLLNADGSLNTSGSYGPF